VAWRTPHSYKKHLSLLRRKSQNGFIFKQKFIIFKKQLIFFKMDEFTIIEFILRVGFSVLPKSQIIRHGAARAILIHTKNIFLVIFLKNKLYF